MESTGGTRASWSDRRESDGAMRGGLLWAPVGEPGESGAVFEAPAFVSGLDDVAVMGEPVEQCRGHLGVTEHDIMPQYRNDCHP